MNDASNQAWREQVGAALDRAGLGQGPVLAEAERPDAAWAIVTGLYDADPAAYIGEMGDLNITALAQAAGRTLGQADAGGDVPDLFYALAMNLATELADARHDDIVANQYYHGGRG